MSGAPSQTFIEPENPASGGSAPAGNLQTTTVLRICYIFGLNEYLGGRATYDMSCGEVAIG